MYQAHGRHQPRQNRGYSQGDFQKPDPRRGGQPQIDPDQMASALKVRNFKVLLETSGSVDNLAVALDVPLSRVNELARGERFTPETAHHIELTLDLPSGFLDSVNPRLTPEVVSRLKSPLNYRPPENERETVSTPIPAVMQQPSNVSVLPVAQQVAQPQPAPAEEPAPKEDVMARTQHAPAASKAHSAPPTAAKKRVLAPVPAPAPAPGTQLFYPDEPILDVRRLNLAVLTEKPGTKSKLGELLNMSPANVSHRLHGLKRLDDDQVMLFTQKLGLSPTWFDEPRTAEDIPAEVEALLDPGPKLPRGTKKARREAAAAAGGKSAAPAARTSRKSAGTRVLAPADVSIPKLSAGIVDTGRRAAPVAAPALASVGAPAPAPRASVPARAAPTKPQGSTSTTAAHVSHAVSAATSVLPDDLQGIGPIAEALIKTLAIKARTGKLDEARAMAMLMEAAQL